MSQTSEPDSAAGTDIDPDKVTGQDPRASSGKAPIAADPEGNPETPEAEDPDEG